MLLKKIDTVHLIPSVSNALRFTYYLNQGNTISNYSKAEVSPSERNIEPEKQENQHSGDSSSQLNLVYAMTSPGDYCHHSYYQETSVGDWNPKPIIGIPIQRGKLVHMHFEAHMTTVGMFNHT